MRKRGRVSEAELAIIPFVRPVEKVKRPDPPEDLTDEQATVWWSVVENQPADWFSGATFPLLVQYCRHVIASRRVAQLVDNLTAWVEEAPEEEATERALSSAKTMDRLLKMQERESRAIATLATKMRVAQQSTYDKSKRNGVSSGREPWEG